MLEELLNRFVKNTPLTVMTRALLENALSKAGMNKVFEENAIVQYTRNLLFSTVVGTMVLVACRIYKSVRAVYLEHKSLFSVTLKCFYDKLHNVEIPVMHAMVRDNAQRLQAVISELDGQQAPLLDGYRVMILDGNALAGTDHRIEELRGIRSAALPGKSLVVYDHAFGLITQVVCCEDAHAQERSLLGGILESIQPDQLWIADRNFCTLGFLMGVANKLGFFLVREHKVMPHKELTKLSYKGRSSTGDVYEQFVVMEFEQQSLKLRRIVINLSEPTRDGEMQLVLLTNVPGACPLALASLYEKRWTIENAFNVLTTNLQCEQKTLGYPKAALFSFCVALLAYNLLATVKAALRSVFGSEKVEKEVSLPKITEHVARKYDGMMSGLPAEDWQVFQDMSVKDLAAHLKVWAAKVDLSHFAKAPTKPKKKKQVTPYDPKNPHVSTGRLLAARNANIRSKTKPPRPK